MQYVAWMVDFLLKTYLICLLLPRYFQFSCLVLVSCCFLFLELDLLCCGLGGRQERHLKLLIKCEIMCDLSRASSYLDRLRLPGNHPPAEPGAFRIAAR